MQPSSKFGQFMAEETRLFLASEILAESLAAPVQKKQVCAKKVMMQVPT